MIDHHSALIYTMVLVAAADREMTDAELASIGDMVMHLPVFRHFDRDELVKTSAGCAKLLQKDRGLDEVLDQIKAALPRHLRETAYAIACDVAAADGHTTQEELRMLEMLRHRLEVPRLAAAAIEHGAKARHLTA